MQLSEWLERLKLDPATPRFFGKGAEHRVVMEAMGLKANFVPKPKVGEPSCHVTLNGRPLRMRKELWRLQPVRALNL
jgi:hypothetical protein